MSQADDRVKRILDYLEARIDLEHTQKVAERHRASLDFQPVDHLPLVIYLPYESDMFDMYPYPEAFHDPAKMMVNELLRNNRSSIFHQVDFQDDAPLCLRPNIGCTLITSMLGAQVKVVDNAMPWVLPLDDKTALMAVADGPLPPFDDGLLPRVIEQYDYFHSMLEDYPNCQTAIQVVLPDLQGPFNNVEMLWGSSIYLAFYDDNDRALMLGLLSIVTDLTLAVYERLEREAPNNIGCDYQYQHTTAQKGRLMLRNDSSTNMSPLHYEEFIRPFDARIADAIGCIGIHSCGNVERLFAMWSSMRGVQCLDVGQPEKNDLDALYAIAAETHIPLTRLVLPAAELKADQLLARFPTGVSLFHGAETLAEAGRVWQAYIG